QDSSLPGSYWHGPLLLSIERRRILSNTYEQMSITFFSIRGKKLEKTFIDRTRRPRLYSCCNGVGRRGLLVPTYLWPDKPSHRGKEFPPLHFKKTGSNVSKTRRNSRPRESDQPAASPSGARLPARAWRSSGIQPSQARPGFR